MLSRRQLLQNAASLALLAGLPITAPAIATEPTTLAALLDQFFDEDLKRSPEFASYLGLDKGELASLKSRLSDRSEAGVTADLDANLDQLRRLRQLDTSQFSVMDRVSYDCVAYVLEQQIALRRDFRYGAPSDGSPYAISQLSGAYQSIPTFLDTKHAIENSADADAYLARLTAFAVALDADSENFHRDEGIKVLPPDFILDTTLHQLAALQSKPEDSILVSSIARRTKDMPGDYGGQAGKIYQEQILPALQRQIAAVTAGRAKATSDAGVWHIKDGAAWYRAGLQISTTTNRTPEEIHKFGLQRAKQVSGEIDSILKAQGLTKGSLKDRIAALGQDPKYFYPNDDAGKAQAIADLQTRLDQIVSQLPRLFHDLPKAKVVVNRVPKIIEEGQALAYYEPGALDGSRPGTIYFNMADSHEWPKWAMPTTLYHEGMPGHHLQGSIAQETPGLPRYRANMFFSGYGEGWALYAEQLADELGVYQNDPLGRLGMLKAQLFRAGRLVVDTGMHHLHWSRDKAVDYLTALTGNAKSGVTREIDRYCVWPGQACSYMIGFSEWNRLRARSQKALAGKFDVRDFHKVALDAGVMPLDVLARVIDGYIKSKAG